MLDALCACGAVHSLDESWAGQEALCSKCCEHFHVPPLDDQAPRVQRAPRHPGPGGPATLVGGEISVPPNGFIPLHCCLVCTRTSSIYPTTLEFSIVSPFALLALLLRRKATVTCPLCNRCLREWKRASLIFRLFMWIGVFVLPLVGGTIGSAVEPKRSIGMVGGLIAGIVAWVAGMIALRLFLIGRSQATAVEISPSVTRLRVPWPEELRDAWLNAEDLKRQA
ncbi:MAG: hypothetical protein AAB074_14235 [Planctomycetota bacterium]